MPDSQQSALGPGDALAPPTRAPPRFARAPFRVHPPPSLPPKLALRRLRSTQINKRELSSGANRSFKRHCSHERFGGFQQRAAHDTHDPDAANLKLSFLRRRSKIVEIVSAGEVVFALTLSGVCAAFSGSRRLCFLNTTPDEVIRSLFYNKANQSLITVSVYRADNFSSLKCRNTPLAYILRGKPDAGFPLFENESLKWPGFVEFDDVNCKVLTYSAQDKAYRVWEMTNYDLLYTLPDDDVRPHRPHVARAAPAAWEAEDLRARRIAIASPAPPHATPHPPRPARARPSTPEHARARPSTPEHAGRLPPKPPTPHHRRPRSPRVARPRTIPRPRSRSRACCR